MNSQPAQPLTAITAQEEKAVRSFESPIRIATRITHRDMQKGTPIRAIVDLMKNPFVLALATWLVIAVIFLWDIVIR